ncbi:MAG: hypothetical protein ACKPAH_12680, partial [Verrucomicrobiota bacterium]
MKPFKEDMLIERAGRIIELKAKGGGVIRELEETGDAMVGLIDSRGMPGGSPPFTHPQGGGAKLGMAAKQPSKAERNLPEGGPPFRRPIAASVQSVSDQPRSPVSMQ